MDRNRFMISFMLSASKNKRSLLGIYQYVSKSKTESEHYELKREKSFKDSLSKFIGRSTMNVYY
jgi:hypothetical protein